MRKLQLMCDTCGDVTIPANKLLVSGTEDPNRVGLSFSCPECGANVDKHCDVATGRLLLMSGASSKPGAAHVTSPLGLADLARLRELLDRPDFISLMQKAA